MQRFRGTPAERAFAAYQALSEAERAEYETIKRTVAKFALNGAEKKLAVGRPKGSKSKPKAAVPATLPGFNAAQAEGL